MQQQASMGRCLHSFKVDCGVAQPVRQTITRRRRLRCQCSTVQQQAATTWDDYVKQFGRLASNLRKSDPANPTSSPGQKSLTARKKSAAQQLKKANPVKPIVPDSTQPAAVKALVKTAKKPAFKPQQQKKGTLEAKQQTHLLLTTSINFKGFGAPPAVPAAVPSSNALKLFRFAVEQCKVQAAVDANGWHTRVVMVDRIQDADAIIAVKLTNGGAHINLSQVSEGCICNGLATCLLSL